jgi:biuret amidohydrolase
VGGAHVLVPPDDDISPTSVNASGSPTSRNLGVSTIVAVGVSLNIAIPNLVMDVVNKGYRVVLPRDAVAGYPAEYGTAVIDNSLSLLATVTSTDELLASWR